MQTIRRPARLFDYIIFMPRHATPRHAILSISYPTHLSPRVSRHVSFFVISDLSSSTSSSPCPHLIYCCPIISSSSLHSPSSSVLVPNSSVPYHHHLPRVLSLDTPLLLPLPLSSSLCPLASPLCPLDSARLSAMPIRLYHACPPLPLPQFLFLIMQSKWSGGVETDAGRDCAFVSREWKKLFDQSNNFVQSNEKISSGSQVYH